MRVIETILAIITALFITWEATRVFKRVKPSGSPIRRIRLALVWAYYLFAIVGALASIYSCEIAVWFLLGAVMCEMTARRLADMIGPTFVYGKRRGED